MKTAVYRLGDGRELVVEYDESAPCVVCGEPVVEASMGGTSLCPWCDMGKCRYCGVRLPFGASREESVRLIRGHMAWHKNEARKAEDVLGQGG